MPLKLMNSIRHKLTKQRDGQNDVFQGMVNGQPVSLRWDHYVQEAEQEQGTIDANGQVRVDLPRTESRWAAERRQYLANDEYRQRCAEEARRQNQGLALKRQREAQARALQERRTKASKDSVRHLRDLCREKYRLDLSIWAERDVLEADQELVMIQCQRADEILQEIYGIVTAWGADLFTDAEEKKVAQKIKDGLLEDGQHVRWTETPPWTMIEEDEVNTDNEWD